MPQDHISQKRAVYRIAGMERAIVRKDVVYRTTDAGPLTMDVYSPAEPSPIAAAGRRPRRRLQRRRLREDARLKFKEMAMSISWGQLIAASGLVAIAYTNREPAADLDALLQHVREQRGGARHRRRPHRRVGLLGQRAARVVGADAARTRLPDAAARCSTATCSIWTARPASREAAATFRFTNPNAGSRSTICRRICRCSSSAPAWNSSRT